MQPIPHFSSRDTTVREDRDSACNKQARSPIPPLVHAHLQVLFSFDVAADDGTRGAGVFIREQSGLFLDVVFVFVSEDTMGDGWSGDGS